MSDLYQNKYRTDTTRASWWDYRWAAAYFVTICTQDRKHFFGSIVDGKQQLSEIGKIAEKEWEKSFEMRPDMNLTMGEYVVMPDHFHGIVIIGSNEFNKKDTSGVTMRDSSTKNQFGPQSKNLASIIRGFKIGVTRQARIIQPDFAWQSLFHDHIIRDEASFQRISQYIRNNPENWTKDKPK